VGKVHDTGHAEYQRKPRGNDAIDGTGDKSIDEQFDKHGLRPINCLIRGLGEKPSPSGEDFRMHAATMSAK
jgi:hypothetical protein